MKLTVMTYNIQHGHAYRSDPPRIDLSETAAVIAESGADVVGLNEVRGRGERADYTAQAETLASMLGWHVFFGRSIDVGGHNPYGNAVLSRYPLAEAAVAHIPDPAEKTSRFEHRSILRAVVTLPDGGLFTVFSSHFGLSRAEQENAVRCASALCAAEKNPFALMGDFNVPPEDDVLAPLFETLNETAPLVGGAKTWPSDDPKTRIDYIFTPRSVVMERAAVLPAQASDHRPVLAEISF